MTPADDRSFESLRIGQSASVSRTIADADIRAFAELSGDYSPLHMDEAYAAAAPYGGRVVHGMFLGALVSQIIGMRLPGARALLVRESLEFKKPVHLGEEVVATATILSKSAATRLVDLDITIMVGTAAVAAGSAQVLVREA